MGIWNWIVDKITEGAPANSRPSATHGKRPATQTSSDGGSAVATLDPDDDLYASDECPAQERWWVVEGAAILETQKVARPELTTEALALENLLVSHFDGHDLKMPPLLHVAEQVLAQLRTRKCSMDAIAKTIADDQVIAAGVLRMANSPLYRGLNKITAIQPALTRLGVRAIRTLMMHESLHTVMFQDKEWSADYAKLLWMRSLATACVMRGLSKFTSIDEEEAHLIGLLHDIGSIIVLRVAHDDRIFSHFDMDLETFDYLCYECHQEFGELVADAWKLPDTLRALISSHHSYPEADTPLRTERLQLELANIIASMLGYGPSVPYDLLNTRAVCDLGLADRNDFIAYLDTLPEQIEEIVDAL